jgi:hypothetical protein
VLGLCCWGWGGCPAMVGGEKRWLSCDEV